MWLLKFLLTSFIFYYLGKILLAGLFQVLGPKGGASQNGARFRGEKPDEAVFIGEMVACDRCGTYVTVERAVKSGGKLFCSAECMGKQKEST